MEGNRDMPQIGYKDIVQTLANQSTLNALDEECSSMDSEDENASSPTKKLSILTDARHCWRKNAKFSDVVAMGSNTHKILKVETISKEDEISSQKHELFGTKKLYEYFDQQGVHIVKHNHDNNAFQLPKLLMKRDNPPLILGTHGMPLKD